MKECHAINSIGNNIALALDEDSPSERANTHPMSKGGGKKKKALSQPQSESQQGWIDVAKGRLNIWWKKG